jgi:hypothetical protein
MNLQPHQPPIRLGGNQTPAESGQPRYRLSNNGHVLYDTTETVPLAGGGQGPKPVATAFDPEVAVILRDALNDRQSARDHAADDIAARAEQRINDLQAEMRRQIEALTRHSERKIGESVEHDPARRDLGAGVWLAVDTLARKYLRLALGTAHDQDDPTWEHFPLLSLPDFDRVRRRAVALVGEGDAMWETDAEEFLAPRAGDVEPAERLASHPLNQQTGA